MNVETTVVSIVKSVSNGLPADYHAINLFEAGVLDSLGIMRLISELDEAFDIELDVDDVVEENFNSIAHITNLVEKYRK